MMSLSVLPPEILTAIFSHLSKLDLISNVQHVSNYWCDVVFSSEIWNLLDLGKSPAIETDAILQHCHLFDDHVRHLIVKYEDFIKFFSSDGVCSMRNLRNLQVINYISDNEVTFFQNIVISFPALCSIRCRLFRSADVTGCLAVLGKVTFTDISIHVSKGGDLKLWNRSLQNFILKQKKLQCLSIHSANLHPKTMNTILINLKCIKTLDLSNSNEVNGSSFDNLTEMTSLSHVDLTSTNIDDHGIEKLSMVATNLKSLYVMNCELVTDSGLRQVSLYCRKLESLLVVNLPGISVGPKLSTPTLKKISKNCPNFRQLIFAECSEISDGGILHLAINCQNLHYVQIEGNNLSSIGLKALSENCTLLRHVDLAGDHFSSDSIEHLLTNHMYLDFLSIEMCEDLSALSLDVNPPEAPSPDVCTKHCHVKKVKFPGSPMDEDAASRLLKFCPDIRYLMFSWSDQPLLKDVIEKLFMSHRFLKTLDINGREFHRKDFVYRFCRQK